MDGQDQFWEVVGGTDKGGILVRQGLELNSAAESKRLGTGSLIKQVRLEGERLQYHKSSGKGPEKGWVSISLKDKTLVERTSKRPSTCTIPLWEGPAKDAPLFDGEVLAENCKGFAHRSEADPLHQWVPLRQVLPDGERRQVLCIGPPSASARNWAAPDAFGSWENSAETGNALAQLARTFGDELLFVESTLTLDRNGWAEELAGILMQRLQSAWVGVGVGVGVWQLVMFTNALSQLGDAGKAAVKNCDCLHMVGFPPPESGLCFPRPKGMDDIDWKFAQSLSAPQSFSVPNNISVYYLSGDEVISQNQVHAWFKLQPSLKDGASKSAYPIFGLQGDHDLLREPWWRTEFFWALANHTWGGSQEPLLLNLSAYQKAAALLGHGKRTISLFDEANDAVLATLDKNPDMLPIPNVNLNEGKYWVQENWTSGNVAAGIGLDIRMYADKSSQPSSDSTVGCRITCAVRFGNNPGIRVSPGSAMGVHGGAIQSVMDEITAQCVRYWAAPACTTRKINHTISGRVFQFQTYKCECDIEKIQDEGCIYVSRALLKDPLGKTVCTTRSDMLVFAAMAALQKSSG